MHNLMVVFHLYGYDIVDKKYVINEREAVIVRKIFDMYIEGMSYINIALNLNMKGYQTKRNKPFAKTSVMSILENEKYTGKYIFNKGTKGNHRIIREDMIVHENAIPQIISKEIFDKAMQRKKTKKNAENTAKNMYLLSGLIKCQCGGTYTGFTSIKTKNGITYKNGYYKCNNHNKLKNCSMPFLKQDLLESKIIKILTEELLNKENMQNIIDGVSKNYNMLKNEAHEDVIELERKLKDINSQIDNIVDMICKGMGTDALAYKLKDLENIKRDLEDELEFKSSKFNNNITPEAIINVLQKDVKGLNANFKSNVKKHIKKWIKKIEVTNDILDVYFNSEDFLPHKMVARSGLEPPTYWV